MSAITKNVHPFKIGQPVRVKGSQFTTTRISRVREVTTNSLGTTVFVLDDGGRCSANELSAI